MESVDVLIVGAGPAGLSTAYYLDGSGLDIIVFESTYNPRSKPCAGLVQAEAFERHPFLKFGSRIAIDKVIVTYNDQDFEVEFNEPISYVIDRESIGWHIVGRIEADVEFGSRVIELKFENDHWLVDIIWPDGDKETYKARYVVGADGIFSIVRRKAEFEDRLNDDTVGVAHQAIVNGYYRPRLFLGNWAPKGYAWVYPDPSGGTRIGIGTLKKFSKGLQDKLFDILNLYDVDVYTPQFGYVPLVGMVNRTIGNNILLVGDSAGHVQPMNGMGIYHALTAGKYAAEAIMEGNLEKYEKSRKKDFGGSLKLGRKALERSMRKSRGKFSKRLAKTTAEILLGRVSRRNLLKAWLILKLGL